jgi:hypothetical protein
MTSAPWKCQLVLWDKPRKMVKSNREVVDANRAKPQGNAAFDRRRLRFEHRPTNVLPEKTD